MAKKVTGYIKLQIPAGKATPAPPVGPALGQHGVRIFHLPERTDFLPLVWQKLPKSTEHIYSSVRTG